jgi:hypothetical protein
MLIRVVAATVAGGIVFMVLGFLIYGLALAGSEKTWLVQYPGLMKEPPNFIALTLSNLAWAFLLAVIYERWARIRTFKDGAIAGAVIMVIAAAAIDLQFKALMVLIIGFTPIIVDLIALGIMGAATGGVVGMVLGMMNKDTTAAGLE